MKGRKRQGLIIRALGPSLFVCKARLPGLKLLFLSLLLNSVLPNPTVMQLFKKFYLFEGSPGGSVG